MFRMSGRKIELYKYAVTYIENEQEITENCISEEHKQEVENMLINKNITFVTTSIDQTSNEWFNGLIFNSYDEALIVFNGGELNYNQNIKNQISTSNMQLRADMDYIAIMTGVEL